MPSIQKIVISLAFAVAVAAQGSQIPDGQVQAVSTVTPTPVAQITDGQVQAVTTAPVVTPVKQITDGQVQAVGTGVSTGVPSPSANGTFAAPSPSAFAGAANILGFSKEIAVAAVGAAAGFAML